MQQTDVSLDILESLDFEPCREGVSGRDCKSLGTAAQWFVVEPCGCDWLACDFHLERRMRIAREDERGVLLSHCGLCGRSDLGIPHASRL